MTTAVVEETTKSSADELADAEPAPKQKSITRFKLIPSKPTPTELADELAETNFAQPSSRRIGIVAAEAGVKVKLIDATEGASSFWLNVISIFNIVLAIGIFAAVLLLDFEVGCLVAVMLISTGYLSVKVASERFVLRVMDFFALLVMSTFGYMGVSMWLLH